MDGVGAMKGVFILLLCLLGFTAIPTIFQFGPSLEASLYPVTTIWATDVRVAKVNVEGHERVRLFFKTESNKFRACSLGDLFFRWRFMNDGADLALVYYTESGEQFRPGTAITTGHLISRELHTDLPSVAYSFKEVYLNGALFYRCHGIWLLPYEFQITLKFSALNELPTAVAVGNPNNPK